MKNVGNDKGLTGLGSRSRDGGMTALCYLCGQPLNGEVSRDHVPPRQIYAQEIRRGHSLNLLTLPVHVACNTSFQQDEDYFVYTLIPFGRGSYSGDALRKKILDDCRHEQQRVLLRQVLREFERNPSGLLLPPGKVVKSFDVPRILGVAWKIVRGLYFADFGTCLPDKAHKKLEIVLPGKMPPESFFVLAGDQSRGAYPGVFDYTVAAYPDFHGLNYWAMLLWDRIILTVTFQDPMCGCAECVAAAL